MIGPAFAAALTALIAAIVGPAGPPAGAAVPDGWTKGVVNKDPYYLSTYARPGTRGIVLIVPGGGWTGGRRRSAEGMAEDLLERHPDVGFDIAAVGYRGGARSLRDTLAAFDELRRRRRGEPICLSGGSSGAHLALMVAVRRGLRAGCVVDIAGPPDLNHWGGREKSTEGKRAALDAFGRDRLERLSPIARARDFRTPILVAAAACDVYIGIGKQRKFVNKLRRVGADVEYDELDEGSVFGPQASHCPVTQWSYRQFSRLQVDFISRAFAAE